MRHCFHEDEWNTLAATGEHDQVGGGVTSVELLARQVAQKPDFVSEIQVANQLFDGYALRTASPAMRHVKGTSRSFSRRHARTRKA